MSPAIDTLSKLIYSRNEEIVFEACWALSHFSDGDNEWIQKVIDSGICPRLIELTKSPSVCIAALRLNHLLKQWNSKKLTMENKK